MPPSRPDENSRKRQVAIFPGLWSPLATSASAATSGYLFVDEAGQVSIANIVAMGTCAKNVVLVGDPMKLSQPIQGSHSGESGLSALEYLLAGHNTVPADRGIFLVAPFVRYLFLALLILIAVRFVVGRFGLRSMFANPPLAEAALYVCILASLVALWL
jgi:hypothetical protein